MGSRAIVACIILVASGAQAAGPAPGISPDEGLLSYWSFQGTTEDVAAAYENASGVSDDDLTAQGGRPRYVCGMVGQAIAIGAEGGDPLWLNAPPSEDIDLGPIYTIEAWIYPTLLDETWQRLVLRWESGAMHYHFALKLVGGRWTVSLYHRQANGAEVNIDAGEVLLQEWQHIAAVADGEFLRVYLDGEEQGAVRYDGTYNAAARGLGIGDMAPGNGLRYNGYLDELAMWNVPLTADEIRSHYLAGESGYGLSRRDGCAEVADCVVVVGPDTGKVGEGVELAAEAAGIDPGAQPVFAWEIVSGSAAIEGQGTDRIRVRASEPGLVSVRVTLKDSRCDGVDDATAERAIAFFGGCPPLPSPAKGLISYWSFDEESTEDEAYLFENNTGKALDDLAPRGGEARFVPGIVGGAIAVGVEAGDALWLDAPDSEDVDLGPIYTIEAWIFPTELAAPWQRFVLRWGGASALHSYHFAIRNSGANAQGQPNVNAVSLFHGQMDGQEPNANGGTVVPNRWQHIACVADGESLRVYLDGREVDAVPYDGTIQQGTGEGLGIAESATSFIDSYRYNGLIDELAIWEVPLTADEIEAHYWAGPDGYCLKRACDPPEIRDSVAIAGPSVARVGEAVTLAADFQGIDPGATATYAWELLEGDATLGRADGPTLAVTPKAAGTVVVRVAVGDGRCDDSASARHAMAVFPGGKGTSPDEGLISYWSFDGTAEDRAAEKPNGSGVADDDLTPRGGEARFVPGIVGEAIAVGVEAGDALWLDAPDSEDVDLGPIYTIEAWIFPTELADSWQRFVLRWGGASTLHSYHFAIRNNGANARGQPNVNAVSLFHGQMDGQEPNANGGTVVPNRWQHIACVADGDSLRVYLDGREVDAVPYDGTIHRGTGEGLGIGDSATALSTIRYNGLIDELAIWNVPLAPEEILSHYEAGPDGYGLEGGPLGPFFIRGDTDGGGSYTIGDGIQILERLFTGRAAFASDCDETGDVDGDGVFTIGDAIRLFNYLFASGPPPAPPANACGTAPIKLGCKKSTCIPRR